MYRRAEEPAGIATSPVDQEVSYVSMKRTMGAPSGPRDQAGLLPDQSSRVRAGFRLRHVSFRYTYSVADAPHGDPDAGLDGEAGPHDGGELVRGRAVDVELRDGELADAGAGESLEPGPLAAGVRVAAAEVALRADAVDGHPRGEPPPHVRHHAGRHLGRRPALQVEVVDVQPGARVRRPRRLERDPHEVLPEHPREDAVAQPAVLGEDLVDDVL